MGELFSRAHPLLPNEMLLTKQMTRQNETSFDRILLTLVWLTPWKRGALMDRAVLVRALAGDIALSF